VGKEGVGEYLVGPEVGFAGSAPKGVDGRADLTVDEADFAQ
jgi:hypothetical protein